MKGKVITGLFITLIVLSVVGFASANVLDDFFGLFKPKVQLSPGSTFTGLPEGFSPTAGYYNPFGDGSIGLWQGNEYYTSEDGTNFQKYFNPIGTLGLPISFIPDVVYAHDIQGGLIGLWDNSQASGNKYYIVTFSKGVASKLNLNGIPAEDNIILGYWHKFGGVGRVTLFNDRGEAYLWDSSQGTISKLNRDTLAGFGLPSTNLFPTENPQVAYYYNFNGMERVDIWYDDVLFRSTGGDFVEVKTITGISGIPKVGYWDQKRNKLVVWVDNKVFESLDGNIFVDNVVPPVDEEDLVNAEWAHLSLTSVETTATSTTFTYEINGQVKSGATSTSDKISGTCTSGSADVNRDGVVNALDIQMVINNALSVGNYGTCDINSDGVVNAFDIQMVINGALGIGNSISPVSYIYEEGLLSFPEDEGKHSFLEWPFVLQEWFANYGHLTAEDGSKYSFFLTLVTYDPLEDERLVPLGDRIYDASGIYLPFGRSFFPHKIFTLTDERNEKVYGMVDYEKLDRFDVGHVNVETKSGDYLRWKGMDKPFEYEMYSAGYSYIENEDRYIDYALNLNLRMVKPPLVLDGGGNCIGYIRQPTGISGYYALTRLQADGTMTIDGITKKVDGILWMDRQFLGSSFALNVNDRYEWWGIQLDNNEEAILYRIWNLETHEVSSTILQINHADGTQENVQDFQLENLGYWTSPHSGIKYSSGWHLSSTSANLDLNIIPTFQDQETKRPMYFWEGSSKVNGIVNGKAVTGVVASELLYFYNYLDENYKDPNYIDTKNSNTNHPKLIYPSLDTGKVFTDSINQEKSFIDCLPI